MLAGGSLGAHAAAPTPIWALETQGPLVGAPVFSGSRVYVASFDRAMYAADVETGRQLWRVACDGVPVGGASCAAGLVVFADNAPVLRAVIAPDGRVKWSKRLPAAPVGPPLATAKGAVVALTDGTVHCYSLAKGKQAWRARLPSPPVGEPCLGWGTVIVATTKGNLMALSLETGKTKWTRKLAQPSTLAPITQGEFVFATPGGQTLTSLGRKTGTHRWARGLPSPALAILPLRGGGQIAVTTADGFRIYDNSGACLVDVVRNSDGTLTPIDSRRFVAGDDHGAVRLFFVSTLETERGAAGTGIPHETWKQDIARGAIVGISAHPTDPYLGVSAADGLLYLLSLTPDSP